MVSKYQPEAVSALVAAVEATHAYFCAVTARAVAGKAKVGKCGRMTVAGADLDALAERAAELTCAAMDKVRGKLINRVDTMEKIEAMAKGDA